jgi:hypothetical protein
LSRLKNSPSHWLFIYNPACNTRPEAVKFLQPEAQNR